MIAGQDIVDWANTHIETANSAPILIAIVATCNRPRLLLERALSSICQQRRLPELVLVIDDSTDEIKAENQRNLAKFSATAPTIAYSANRRSTGASGAWNTALDYLCATNVPLQNLFVAILDDDDEWHANYLHTCLQHAQQHNGNMICTGFYRIENQPNRHKTCSTQHLPPQTLEESLFLTGNPGIQGSNLVLRLDLLMAAGGFDENLASCTDRDLCIRLCELTTLKYTPVLECLVNHYAEHNRSRLSTPGSKAKLAGLDQFWRKYQSRMTEVEQQQHCHRANTLFNWHPPLGLQSHEQRPDKSVPKTLPTETATLLKLHIGVICGDAKVITPLLRSFKHLFHHQNLEHVTLTLLCNGCEQQELQALIAEHVVGKSPFRVDIIDEAKQAQDVQQGLFGDYLTQRQAGVVTIASARTMLQQYIGLQCAQQNDTLVWLLDDDMQLDSRATSYITWFACYIDYCKTNHLPPVDVFIGAYEGASPNPPLNGLRVQLCDLLHNIRWLQALPAESTLPDRSAENRALRLNFPDYYYDLSRKHTGHLESPFWLESEFPGETVDEALTRLQQTAPLITSGWALTRAICHVPLSSTRHISPDTVPDSVNRGGNTFVLNIKALTDTPNLIPKIHNRELRRSDMIWAMVNKYHHGMTLKAVPFPVMHASRGSAVSLNDSHNWKEKVQDELMGSAVYAGLQTYFAQHPQANMAFDQNAINGIWQYTQQAKISRLQKLKQSVLRINGLAVALENLTETKPVTAVHQLAVSIKSAITPALFNQICHATDALTKDEIARFLTHIPSLCTSASASRVRLAPRSI